MSMQNIFSYIANSAGKLVVAMGILTLIPVSELRADVVPDVHRRMHAQMQEEQYNSQLFQAMVDSLTNQNEREEEFNLYSSLDLDTGWDDEHVDPLRGKSGITIPDSALIPMKGFVPPIIGKVNSPWMAPPTYAQGRGPEALCGRYGPGSLGRKGTYPEVRPSRLRLLLRAASPERNGNGLRTPLEVPG